VEGKLPLIDAILRNGWVGAADTLKPQCLGIAFGDALAQHLGLQWVTVEDEHGRDPALRLPGTSILLFPMTSISKRMEQGEAVDVHGLFGAACSSLQSAAAVVDPQTAGARTAPTAVRCPCPSCALIRPGVELPGLAVGVLAPATRGIM
jgi:hypothetical protein